MPKQILVSNFKTTFEYLEALCKQAGTTLNEVCRSENIMHGIVRRWKNEDPKSIQILRTIEAGIRKKKSNHKASAE